MTSRFHSGVGGIYCTLAAGDLLAQCWGLVGLGVARGGHKQHALFMHVVLSTTSCATKATRPQTMLDAHVAGRQLLVVSTEC